MMTEWREKVADRQARVRQRQFGLPETGLAEYPLEGRQHALEEAQAAIAELLPLVKAELAKVAAVEMRKQGHDIDPPSVIAAIEAWEPQHD